MIALLVVVRSADHLAEREVLSALSCEEAAVGAILPEAHVDRGDLLGSYGIGEDRIGDVLRGNQRDLHLLVARLLPLGDDILEELLELERADELKAGAEENVGLIAELVERVQDELAMQLAQLGCIGI